MVNVAIMGFGVVGTGVATSIALNNEQYKKRNPDCDVNIKYILDLREFPDHPLKDRVVHDINIILDDPSVSIVVETMGGINPAYNFTKQALERGKSVVTSNKAVVAAHGAELFEIAKQNGVSYLFEASVGGGIPIIRPLWQCLAANSVIKISGILNGTCNYILTKMVQDKIDLSTALFQAQELGYAEKDPTADIEGMDTCRKICILSSLAFGKTVDPETIRCEGITSIEYDDIQNASSLGYSIKLLGNASLLENGKVDILTAPFLVPKNNLLASINDVYNGIQVTGNLVGETLFYGKGAGSLATASAVVADVLDIINNKQKNISWKNENADFISDSGKAHSFYYIRTNVNEDTIRNTFGDVEIHSCDNGVYFTTDKISESKVEEFSNVPDGYFVKKIRLMK